MQSLLGSYVDKLNALPVVRKGNVKGANGKSIPTFFFSNSLYAQVLQSDTKCFIFYGAWNAFVIVGSPQVLVVGDPESMVNALAAISKLGGVDEKGSVPELPSGIRR